MKSRLMLLLFGLALAAFTVAACGDDEEGGSQPQSPAGETTGVPENEAPEQNNDAPVGGDEGADAGGGETTELQIAADPGGALKFDKESLEAPAGEVKIVMDNPSSLPHAVEIEGAGAEAKGETVGKGGKSEATADLKAGEYRYYCPVAGHGEAGMEGTLTVE